MPPKATKREAPGDDGAQQDTKVPKLSFKDLGELQLDARGLKDSTHGDIYQLNLLMLVLWRAMRSNYLEFALATEHPKTDKFDDIVVIYRTSSDRVRKCSCLQAKHREASDKIGSEDKKGQLTEAQLRSETGDFALQKYFASFLKIKKETDTRGSSLFGCKIEDISILTNRQNDLQVENFKNSMIDHESLLGLRKNTNSSARRYQIRKDSDFYEKLKAVLAEKYSTEDMKEFPTFIETLGIIADYPNRTQVNEMLLQEMEAHYSILDGAAKIALYRDEMLKWFAERKCTFITPAKCDDLFASLEGRVRSYELLGSTNAYLAKAIGQYQFQEDDEVRQGIQCFLESSDARVLLFRFDKIELAQPRISQAFMRIMQTSRGSNNVNPGLPRFIQHFGYIFIFLDQLLNKEFTEKIKSELNSTQKCSLLVIDSQPMNYGVLADFIRYIHAAEFTDRKVIIFSEEKLSLKQLGLPAEWKVQNAEKQYITKLSDLTIESQNKFRQQCNILFQSREKKFEQVFEADDDDLFSSEVLAALMFGDQLEIGLAIPTSPESYIERTFITGVRGDLYKRTRLDKVIDENSLLARKNRVNIFSDLPGMGKSEMLTSLSRKLGWDFGFWVVRVDFNRYSCGFNVESLKRGGKGKYKNKEPSLRKGNIPSAVSFLLELFQQEKQHSPLPNDVSRELFRRVVESGSRCTKIAMFFDGFDELHADYVDIALDLLDTINKANVAQIFLTARPFMVDALKTVFTDENSEKFHLEKLSWPQRYELFERKWAHLRASTDCQIKRLKQYVDIIMEKHAAFVDGNPLHIHLIVDLFEEDCREFLEAEVETPQRADFLNFWDLYEQLVKKKFDIYCYEKAGTDGTNSAVSSIMRNRKEQLYEQHQMLAAFSLLPPEDFENFCLSLDMSNTTKQQMKAITTVEDNIGLVDAICNGVPHFVHQTFAEYFLTTIFVDYLLAGKQSGVCNNFLMKFILKGGDSRIFIETWFDTNLKEIKESVVEEFRKIAIDMLIKDEMGPFWSLNSRGVFSLIVDSASILDTLESYSIQLTKHTTKVVQYLDAIIPETQKDKFFAFLDEKIQKLLDELTLSHSYESILLVIELINMYCNHFELEKWTSYLFLMDNLKRYIDDLEFDQIKFLLRHKAVGDVFKHKAFCAAAFQGNIDSFMQLSNMVTPDCLKSPLILQEAAVGGSVQICQILLSANQEDMEYFICSSDGTGALHAAAMCEHSNVCKILLKEHVNICKRRHKKPEIFVDIVDKVLDDMSNTLTELFDILDGRNPVDLEAIFTTWKMEDTIFHLLIFSGAANIVRLFLDEGFCFRGNLFYTILWLHLNYSKGIQFKTTLEILLNHIKSKKTCVPECLDLDQTFLVAVACGHIAIVEVLLETGVNVDIVENGPGSPNLASEDNADLTENIGRSSLHILAENDFPEGKICQLILESVPYKKRVELLSLKNLRRETPLHLAAKKHHKKLIKVMLDSVTDVHNRTELISCQEEDGRTVLHCCYDSPDSCSTLCDLLELLIGYMDAAGISTTINTRDNAGRSVLHEAVRFRDVSVIKLLLSKGADINAVDSNNKSVLHLATLWNDCDLMLFLVNCFDPSALQIQINAADCSGMTALDYAVYDENDSIIELLTKRLHISSDINMDSGDAEV